MILQILWKNVYGKLLAYPNCEKSRLLVQLTNAKTFTKANLETLKALGYDLQYSGEVPNV